MVHAALLLLMLEAVHTDLVFTISLKRSTQNLQLSTSSPADYPIFAASDAKLGQPEIRIAFIPPIATTQALARLIGRPRAIRYLYEGRLLGAAEALAWGLVD